MLVPVYPPFRKRNDSKPRRRSSSPPPGEPILVQGVLTLDEPVAGFCIWYFDHDVTIVGPVTGLAVNVEGAWLQPISATQLGGNPMAIECTYDTGELLDGKAYQTEGPITGILQAAQIQDASGTVEAP